MCVCVCSLSDSLIPVRVEPYQVPGTTKEQSIFLCGIISLLSPSSLWMGSKKRTNVSIASDFQSVRYVAINKGNEMGPKLDYI